MKGRRLTTLGFFLIACLVATGFAAARVQPSSNAPAHTVAASDCQLNSAKGNIKHVIYIVFDNVHFIRDNPNVPSDLEQMPHLLNFIRSNGTMMTNNHTVLISHTANGILTSLTGMYSDRHGQSVTNSFRYFKADGSTASSSSFKYWTDLTDDVNTPPTDPAPIMVNGDSGSPKNTPAPWVPYTRANCDFGATALANVVLENTATGPNGDMTKVFGSGSPEWLDAQAAAAAPSGTAARSKAQTDYVGIAIHCASGGGICASNAKARPDLLPDEPGGYNGFKGLFGAKYVNPAITGGNAAVNDLNGNPVGDQFGQPGFPGFDGLFASTTLGYVAQMQEAGIPITFGYISDAHDEHGVAGEIHIADGPGQAPYVTQLKRYDDAFVKFFDRLAADGITKENTLFMFTTEESDHFVGSKAKPEGCNGVTQPCSYDIVSEVNANLAGLLATQQGITTPFTVHSDMSPTIYITGNPGRDAAVTRDFGRALSKLAAVNPITGETNQLNVGLADPVGMKALHMITADPQRTPTLTWFAHPDYFFFAAAANCASPCVFIPPPSNFTFAWNHGSIDPEIVASFLGMVGPGVRTKGDDATWADHTDERATMLSLLGLKDTYVHDGRVLIDQLEPSAVPASLRAHRETLRRLGEVYKQLNAPLGTFSMNLLNVSTKAIKSGSSSDDGKYVTLEAQIKSLTSQRDELATRIKGALDGAAFSGAALNEQEAKRWIEQAQKLLIQAAGAASAP